MPLRVVRLGTPRLPNEGLRLGTVRRPPRGVRKQDYAARDFFDLWFPELAPSAPLVASALSQEFTPARWARYAARYRREMERPTPQRILALLAALSRSANFSIGCYCKNETRCHRSVLKEMLVEKGALVVNR